jgi:hypothetical protein
MCHNNIPFLFSPGRGEGDQQEADREARVRAEEHASGGGDAAEDGAPAHREAVRGDGDGEQLLHGHRAGGGRRLHEVPHRQVGARS